MCDIMQGLGDPDITHFAGYNCGERVDIAGSCNPTGQQTGFGAELKISLL